MPPVSTNLLFSCIILLSFVFCNCASMKGEIRTLPNFERTPREVVSRKDPSLDYCFKDVVREGQYRIFENGTLYTGVFNRTLSSSSYLRYDDGRVAFCCTSEEATMIRHWTAAHYLLSSLFIQYFVLLVVRLLVKINSRGIFNTMLVLLIFLNIVLHAFTILSPLHTQELWTVVPYALVFATIISITWLVLLSFDFIILFLKLFAQRIYANPLTIGHVNRAIRIFLALFSALVIIVSLSDLFGICISQPGYKARAMEYLDSSLPYNTYLFAITCAIVVVCSVREIVVEKYADAFVWETAETNARFQQLHATVVYVCIFFGAMVACKNWILWSAAMLLIIATSLLGFSEKDFSNERESFYPYTSMDGEVTSTRNPNHIELAKLQTP